MNIIIVNDYAYINGGAAQVAISSAVALARESYNVFLFTAVGQPDEILENIPNLHVICLQQYDILHNPNRLGAIFQGLWNNKSKNEFKKLLSSLDKKDTIVHVHACSKAITTSCIRVAMKMDFEVIYHLHDYGVACPNLGFYHYRKQDICKMKPLGVECLFTNCDSRAFSHKVWRCIRQFVQIYLGKVPGNIKNFIAVSDFSYQILKEYIPSKSIIHFVKNPINIFKRPPVEVAENQYCIYIGRLTPEKNPVLLARVAKKMEFPVIFIGEGPCEQEIREVNPQAILTGWLKFEQAQEYFTQARCLVLTSAWYETQGMVVAEAAARGVPSVVPDTCAARDWIDDGINGFIFQSKNESDLAEKLNHFRDRLKAKQMGISAYKSFWQEKTDMDNYITNILKIYQKILGTKRE